MILRANFKPMAKTLAEVVRDLGDIPLSRIRAGPPPGTAPAAALDKPGNKLCELIDGVLVEKQMGSRESTLGLYIGRLIGNFVEEQDLGVVTGADGLFWVKDDQLRAPDVTFFPWSSFPDGEPPENVTWWSAAPGLCVEVLSPSNTTGEIDRKLREVFGSGCKLAWVIDPEDQTARVYTSPKRFKLLDKRGVLSGGKVLPGFKLPLADVFSAGKRRKKK
ncbi:MAG: Uma2 family endonuclease [Gemmataceae bacterium]